MPMNVSTINKTLLIVLFVTTPWVVSKGGVTTVCSPAIGGKVVSIGSLKYEAIPNSGYEFSHWKLSGSLNWADKQYTNNPYDASGALMAEAMYGGGELTLVAYFKQQSITKYSIKFVDADGVQIGDTQILEEGQSATPPTPPAREGYTFVGWIGTYTDVKSNATIYASYSRNDNLSTTQQGGLPGLFSVAPDKQVYFSQGNLQYMGATQTWRFAENQYDTIGIFNNNISSSYNGWIDLFGWGTSGWDSGAKEYQPYSTSTTNADYYPGNASNNDLTGSYEDADWGIYNAIYNGGNKAGLWRTLTQDEWLYLYSERANADTKHAYATINGIGGYILLPDNWILPSGLTFDASGTNANQYTKEQWKMMEQNGAVFLPAAGFREGLETRQVLKLGDYWLSTSYDADNACRVYFTSAKDPESYPKELRHYGFSVRLVGPVPTYKIIVNPSNDLMGSTSGGGRYDYGESIQIVANPYKCHQFKQWSDGNTDNPRTITVTSNATYTAEFIEKGCICDWMTLTQLQSIVGYQTSDDNSIILNNDKKNYIFKKMRVTYSYKSNLLDSFIIIKYSDNGNTALEFTFGDDYQYRINGSGPFYNDLSNQGSHVSDKTYEYDLNTICNTNGKYFYIQSWQKNFIPDQVQICVEQIYEITTSAINGTITGGGAYNINATATLTAKPNECYHFSKWSDGNTDNPRTIIVDGDATYTAIFEKDTYTIIVESADESQGSVQVEIN